jgi:hypothetical protein
MGGAHKKKGRLRCHKRPKSREETPKPAMRRRTLQKWTRSITVQARTVSSKMAIGISGVIAVEL